MRSRHNAALHIIFDEEPFHLFLTGFGNPDNVKSLVKLSVRGIRRYVETDPEEIAVNIFYYAKKKTTVHLMRREEKYAFTYHINLPARTVRIKSNSADETFNLFEWIGSQRTISEKPKEPRLVKRKRGRPSATSYLAVAVPENFTIPEGGLSEFDPEKHRKIREARILSSKAKIKTGIK